MNSNFLNNLEKSLRAETVPQENIDKIIESYKNYVLEAHARGESEDKIEETLGNPVNLATEFRKTLEITPTVVTKKINPNIEEPEKRSLSTIFGSLLLVFLINIVAVPITVAGFIVLIALLIIPISLIGIGVSLILYQAIYVNGYELVLSLISSISIGIAAIGLSIFITIGIYYLIKWFGKLTTLFYSHESNLIRRCK